MNTDLEKAFTAILYHGLNNSVPQEDMPSTLLIISDMEFDCVSSPKQTVYENMVERYKKAGYNVPKVVFWNLNGRIGNVPVSFKEDGTALISGFSPTILSSLMGGDSYNPLKIVENTVLKPRYDY
jgi:hypothetical protein